MRTLRREYTPRVGEQYVLDLFKGVPWDGRSPRVLTRGRSALFLRREPPSHAVYVDPEQLDFWRRRSQATQRKKPPPTVGAPSLLPLKASPEGVWRGAMRFPKGG